MFIFFFLFLIFISVYWFTCASQQQQQQQCQLQVEKRFCVLSAECWVLCAGWDRKWWLAVFGLITTDLCSAWIQTGVSSSPSGLGLQSYSIVLWKESETEVRKQETRAAYWWLVWLIINLSTPYGPSLASPFLQMYFPKRRTFWKPVIFVLNICQGQGY